MAVLRSICRVVIGKVARNYGIFSEPPLFRGPGESFPLKCSNFRFFAKLNREACKLFPYFEPGRNYLLFNSAKPQQRAANKRFERTRCGCVKTRKLSRKAPSEVAVEKSFSKEPCKCAKHYLPDAQIQPSRVERGITWPRI